MRCTNVTCFVISCLACFERSPSSAPICGRVLCDTRLILMSATINVNMYSEYFHNCPVIQVPGRLFPIKLRYLPQENEPDEHLMGKDEKLYAGIAFPFLLTLVQLKSARMNAKPFVKVLEMIDTELPSRERCDCLIFLRYQKSV